MPTGIHDTPLNRLAVLAALKALRSFRPRRANVLFLTNRICIKYGRFIQLSEAFTLQFVASHTSIPVPKVFCAFVHKGCTYIVMERIKGDVLLRTWHSQSEDSRNRILAQLKKMVDEMRVLPAPGPRVANVLGGALYDARFPRSMTIGPFGGVYDFHVFLRNGMVDPPTHDRYPELRDMLQLQDQPWPMPVFTHGDLSPFNILVRDGHVVAIIDWETAGWYPSYWEYSMARLQGHPYAPFWSDLAEHFIDPLVPQELDMERTRLQFFGGL